MIAITKIRESFKKSSFFKDSIWALIGSVLGNGLALIVGIFIARFLGRDIYGEYGMIKTTLLQIAVFSTFGLGLTITRYIALYKREHPEKIYPIIRFSLIITCIISGGIALLVLIFSNQIATFIDAPQLSPMLKLASLAIIFNAIDTTQVGVLAGFKAFKAIAINKGLSGIVTFILSIILTYLYGLIGAIISLSISLVFNCFINFISVQKRQKLYSAFKEEDISLNKEIFRFSFPVALQDSSYAITHWLVAFIIIKLSDYGQLGIYNASAQWGAIITFLPSVLGNVMLSYFSENANNYSGYYFVNRMLLINGLVTFIPFIVVLFASKLICSLYGDDFVSMNIILIIVAFSAFISSLISVYNKEFMAKGHNWFLFFSRLIRDIMTLGLFVFLGTYYSKHGTALLFVVSSLIFYIGYLLFLHIIYKRKRVYYEKRC